jgi:hypothetical protein
MARYRRTLDELVFERLAVAIDHDALIQLQMDLIHAVARAASPTCEGAEVDRRTRRLLRRAWRRYGELLVVTLPNLGQATLAPPR